MVSSVMDEKKTHIESNGPSASADASLLPGESRQPYELSPLQEGMLIHSLADPGVGMYVSQGVFSFGQIDVPSMKQAWQTAVNRHDVLRTAFEWEDLPRPRQVVYEKVGVEFEIHGHH